MMTVPLTCDEARALTDILKAKFDEIAPLILRAYLGQAFKALGYSTWEQYCNGELGGGITLPLDARRAVVAELTREGMTTRPIASALGTTQSTVTRDRVSQNDSLEIPETVHGADGRTYRTVKGSSSIPPNVEHLTLERVRSIPLGDALLCLALYADHEG